MKNWLMVHFDVQKGMYFDTLFESSGMTYFGSDQIVDSVWNYGIVDEISDRSLIDFEKFCKSLNKPCNLYVSKDTAVQNNSLLTSLGFNAPTSEGDLITETWMSFKKKNYVIKAHFDIQKVTTEKQLADFIDVFVAAYGGEKTPDKPYGDLPDEYALCVKNSFGKEKFYNYVCYFEGVPVSIASLCMSEKNGGLYNVGTKPKYEKRGFGLAVTDACVNQWKRLEGQRLFLQTETGTGIDTWYERMGFETLFYGAIYEKD